MEVLKKALDDLAGYLKAGLLPLIQLVLLVALIFPFYQFVYALAVGFGAVVVPVLPLVYPLVALALVKYLRG